MINLISQWYKSKVNAFKVQNESYDQLVGALQEASNIVTDDDNTGWTKTSSNPEYKGHTVNDQESMIQQARRYFRFDPNGRAAVWTLVKYIMGKGLKISPQSKDPRIHKLWKEFWSCERNNMELRQFEIIWRGIRDGEVLMQFFNKDEDGAKSWKTTVRFRDPVLLHEGTPQTGGDVRKNARLGVEVDPEDPEKVLRYWFSDPYMTGKVSPTEASEIIHIKLFADMDQKRGESHMQPIMKYFEHYKQWMKYRIILNKIRTAVVMVRKVTGGTSADISRIAQTLQTSATAKSGDTKKQSFREGTILNANAGIDYEFKSPNINATDAAEDGRKMKIEMAAGSGQPEYVFGDSSNSNFASTMVAEAPFVKEVQFWQTFFEFYFKKIFKRVVQAAVNSGKLQAPLEDDIFIEEGLEAVQEATIDAVVAKNSVEDDAKEKPGEKPIETKKKPSYLDKPGIEMTEYEAFYGCDVQWPEIIHREMDKTTDSVIKQVEAGLVSEPTAALILGYDYDEEMRKQKLIEDESASNPFKQNQLAQDEMDMEMKQADLEMTKEITAAKGIKESRILTEYNDQHDDKGRFASGEGGSETSNTGDTGGASNTGDTSGASNIGDTGGSSGVVGSSYGEMTKEEFNKHSRETRKTRIPETYEAGTDYQSSETGYTSTNNYLRESATMSRDEIKEGRKITEGIDKAFELAPELSADTVLYRGFDSKRLVVEDPSELVGKQIVDKGFVSTTIDKSIARSFASKTTTSTILEINVKKGTRVLTLSGLTSSKQFASEREVLLNRGSTFNITASRKEGSKTVLVAEYVNLR